MAYVVGAVLRFTFHKYVCGRGTDVNSVSIFDSLLIGLTTIVTIYSIYITHGKTVHWLFILVPIGIAIYNRWYNSNAISVQNNEVRLADFFSSTSAFLPLLLCFLAGLPFMLYEASHLLKTGSFPFKTTDIDFNYYGIFSESIYYSGNENKFTTLNFTAPQLFNGCVPYHYFELHLNSLIAHLFSLPPVPTLMLLTYPMLNIIGLAGIVRVFSALNVKLNVKYALFTIVLMGLSGIYLSAYAGIDFLKYGSGLVNASPISLYGKKNAAIILFAIPVAYSFATKRYFVGLILACNIVIANVGTLPGVFGAVAFTALAALMARTFRVMNVLALALYFILFALCFFLFYKLNPNTYTTSYLQKGLFFQIIETPGNLLLYKQIVVNVYTLLLRFSIYYAPIYGIVLLQFIVVRRKEWFAFMGFSVFALFFGALGASLAYGLMDSLQLFSNVISINTVFVWVSIVLVIDSISLRKAWYYSFIAYVVALSLYSIVYSYGRQSEASAKIYGDDYIINAQQELRGGNAQIGGYILSPAEYQSINPAWVYRHRPATFLQSIGTGYKDLIDLGIINAGYDMDKQKVHDQYYYSMNEVVMLQQTMKNVSTDSVILACIDKYKLKVVFLSKNAEVPQAVLPRIHTVTTDKVSGEKMILLR